MKKVRKHLRKLFVLSLTVALVITLSACAAPSGNGSSASSSGLLKESVNATKLTRANGEVFPNRQIEIIVPLAAGGGTDVFCRQIANAMYKIVGVPVVVNNVTGASGLRGIGVAMKAAPDGYTLVATNPPAEQIAQMLQDPGYDMRQLTPLSHYSSDAVVMVARKDCPYNTFPELVEAYKSGKLVNIGATSTGSADEIGARLLKEKAGLAYKKCITYGGSGDLVGALLKNELSVGVCPSGAIINGVRDGQLKPIMMLTAERFPTFPDTPAYGKDYGYDSIDAVVYQSRLLLAPPNLPDDIRDYLQNAIQQALKDPELVAWAKQNNLPLIGAGSKEAGDKLKSAFDIPKLIDLNSLKK
jgi:tripartite-type tricarboxylate transporter receptor subunit TctC